MVPQVVASDNAFVAFVDVAVAVTRNEVVELE